MNTTVQKFFIIVIGIMVVLFLLLDGGAMTEAAISAGMASDGARIGHSLIWLIPTLLIFGLGFLLAWIVLGKDEASNTARNAMPDEAMEGSSQDTACYWERLDDPRQAKR